MKTFLVGLFIFVFACSCLDIKYQADSGFLNSAQANSPEYLVRINSKVCKDMDDEVGLCAKRVRSDETVTFKLDRRPYAYRLDVKCTSEINSNLRIDIPSEKDFSFEIPASKFSTVKSFTCIGEIFPMDRPQEVSAMWHSRFVVYDKNYSKREAIHLSNDLLVFGQNSLYATLNDDRVIQKKSMVKVKGVKVERAYSESYTMRMNYHGY